MMKPRYAFAACASALLLLVGCASEVMSPSDTAVALCEQSEAFYESCGEAFSVSDCVSDFVTFADDMETLGCSSELNADWECRLDTPRTDCSGSSDRCEASAGLLVACIQLACREDRSHPICEDY